MAGFKIVKIGAIAVLTIAVFGTLIVVLWNWLMPSLFNLPTINFAQALGLFALCRLLMGGVRLGSVGGGGHWAERREMMENWKNMSPDERERMKQEWKSDWREKCNNRRPIGFNRPETGEPTQPNCGEQNKTQPKDLI
jgi:Ca2+/H+ antiporter, TMEM165/GDT1 family